MNWYQKARLQAVETLANWTGRVNTTDIIRLFGVSRVIAQGDIHSYLKLAPGNLSYNRQEKAYLPSSQFSPILSGGQLNDYLTLESSENGYISTSDLVTLQPPALDISPSILRPIFSAIKQKLGVSVKYRSLNHPNGEKRRLFPHSLVNTGFRWHIRAYCENRQDFRDFNLSRMCSVESIEQARPETAYKENDASWQNNVNVILQPNPLLNEAEQNLIESEFKMTNKQLEIHISESLLPYYLQMFQVPTDETDDNPRQYRLVVKNLYDIKKYLFSS